MELLREKLGLKLEPRDVKELESYLSDVERQIKELKEKNRRVVYAPKCTDCDKD
jgi:CRISPR/Cas system-associated exonuclease Cas4 (RecB family)